MNNELLIDVMGVTLENEKLNDEQKVELLQAIHTLFKYSEYYEEE